MEENSVSTKYDRLGMRGRPYSPYKYDYTDRVAVFLDVRNITKTLHDDYIEADFDFRKLLMDVVGDRKCVLALAVDGTHHEDETWSTGLQCMLKECGFRLDLVPATNSSGKQEGTDVELALKAYKYAIHHWCDHIVLITGDGDFSVLVKELQDEGMVVNVVSFDENLSRKLKRTSDSVTLLEEMALVRMKPVMDDREEEI